MVGYRFALLQLLVLAILGQHAVAQTSRDKCVANGLTYCKGDDNVGYCNGLSAGYCNAYGEDVAWGLYLFKFGRGTHHSSSRHFTSALSRLCTWLLMLLATPAKAEAFITSSSNSRNARSTYAYIVPTTCGASCNNPLTGRILSTYNILGTTQGRN